MSIILEGRAEFEAQGVEFRGNCTFRVPDGFRMLVTTGADGFPRPELIPLGSRPSWEWRYGMAASGEVKLSLEQKGWWDLGQVPGLLLSGEDMGIVI